MSARKATSHEELDRVPLDLGSTLVTGIQASMNLPLKKAFGIECGRVHVQQRARHPNRHAR
ncbi:MAG: hypothetical protein JW820_19720 [Spirochaetales bacterium]|nr:hypothetical protein [Spirochaetales bacterium]